MATSTYYYYYDYVAILCYIINELQNISQDGSYYTFKDFSLRMRCWINSQNHNFAI